ncbi:MAG: transporter, partial [Glaciihabitans sp.]|nr:transporter [Glaciihabitans sp.]
GLLTSLPVLAFALTTPIAAALLTRIGPDFAVAMSLLGIIAGVAIRSAGSIVPLFVGTVIMGFAITLGNVMVPVLIRRNYSEAHRASVTGLYTAALNVGSMLTLVATVPLADAVGWQWGLETWSGLAVGALVVWALAVGWRRFSHPRRIDRTVVEIDPDPNTEALQLAHADRRLSRSLRWRILILAAGFGGQAFSYYGLTAWLPQILAATSGLEPAVSSAGSSLFQVCAIVGALGAPMLTKRLPYWSIFVMLSALWGSVPVGLLLAPDSWWLWLSLGGIAQGGIFTMIFIVIVELARSDAEAARYSALAQGIGYAIGATGPSVVGALHEASGGWNLPITAVLAAVIVLAAGTLIASRGMGSLRR